MNLSSATRALLDETPEDRLVEAAQANAYKLRRAVEQAHFQALASLSTLAGGKEGYPFQVAYVNAAFDEVTALLP